MIGWHLQTTEDGELPAAVDLRNGDYLIVSEAPLDKTVHQITPEEIAFLESKIPFVFSDTTTNEQLYEHLVDHLNAIGITPFIAAIVPLRLYRFGLVDRDGVLTIDGEVALSHLAFERHGVSGSVQLVGVG